MKNPTKLMGLVKTIGDKLDSKLKSGELKESEMIQEATDIMNSMKNMPGMGNIQSMLNKMGMGHLGGLGGKVNSGAMEAELNKKMRQIAKLKKLKLSEYGLFKENGDKININDERDVFNILEIEYLVPRLR
jgi:DNA polymerase/3'-5' exonuclease PolX